jgi:diguanylate cyclase (GGDEF)-like protein
MAPHIEDITSTEAFLARIDDAVGGDALAVALSDLDDFRTLNEEHGMDVGDAVLEYWDRVIRGSLPRGSVVGRLGGDEYAIALPGSSVENALIVLQEIRTHLAQHPLEALGRPIQATIGVAARPPHATETGELLRCANAALMRGKREGGDRVAIYIEEKMVLKSNYYPRADLDRLAKLAGRTDRTEASLLREALEDLFAKHRDDS